MAGAVDGEKGIETAAPQQAADGEGGDGGEKSAFRCIDVVRFTVASVVMVLIVSVIVNAVQVLLRTDDLEMSVARGTVFLRQTKPEPPRRPAVFFFDMDLRAQNPGGRVRMYYLHVLGYLLDNNTLPTTSTPGPDSIVYFPINDFDVPQSAGPQQGRLDKLKEVNVTRGKNIGEDWFDKLFGRTDATFGGVTLRLEGVLVTESYNFNHTHPVTYLCGPLLLVGGDPNDEDYNDLEDVLCEVANIER